MSKTFSFPQIEIMQADNKKYIGFTIKETIGIGVINTRGIKKEYYYICY